MKNLLSTYLDKRMEGPIQPYGRSSEPGPVITISREVGCKGLKMAGLIAEMLYKHSFGHRWKVLSKEVFYESAKELNLDYNRVTRVFKSSDKYTFEEMLNAFSNRYYINERKIVKTVVDVIHSFAVEGFCIIVGRAGHLIAGDIKNSLHLRLVAPLEYRVENVVKSKRINRDKALEYINVTEKERLAFRKALSKDELSEEKFDLVINCASFSSNSVVDMVQNAVMEKKMFANIKEQVFLF